MADLDPEALRLLLCDLGAAIRKKVCGRRPEENSEQWAAVSHVTEADTIYAIDRLSDEAILEWFEENWPATEPVQIVMEGLPDNEARCFPRGISWPQTRWKCLIDPIDGTRCLMYDKRSAWALAGLAPQRGSATVLSDIFVAAMTELPTTRQWRSDQISAVRGGGLAADSTNILDGRTVPFIPQPSRARNFTHGFSWMAKYFPEGRALTSQIEEQLWSQLGGAATVFDDQYLSTGGAFYELLAGHDRMVGDLRPLVFGHLQLPQAMTCHPYDVCTALLLAEAGVVYEDPWGDFPDAPLDTTTGVAWIAFANEELASQVRPVLRKILREMLSRP